jgi:hypothetical protein
MLNVYTNGPYGKASIKLLAYDLRAVNAIREIRELIQPWGDNESAQMIRVVLSKWDV